MVKQFSKGHPDEPYSGTARGAATILSGAATVVVTHGLGAAPVAVVVTGSHAEVLTCTVTSISSTQFTITTTVGNTTADRVVYWVALV